MHAPQDHPLLDRLRSLAVGRPLVVAHRGDSRHHPENTLPAFTAAALAGAPLQEFDVRVCGDGQLVCLHDETLDRTTDAATVLGPGAMVAQLPLSRLRELDAGAWKGPPHRDVRLPTLAEALQAMLPRSIPMIEHKAGSAAVFVAELRRLDAVQQVILQSFDWGFLTAVRSLEPALLLGALGPNEHCRDLDTAAVDAVAALGAGLLHWHAPQIRWRMVRHAHGRGLLVCSYTSDDELSWHGGRAIGLDAMCSNDPTAMLEALAASGLTRRPD